MKKRASIFACRRFYQFLSYLFVFICLFSFSTAVQASSDKISWIERSSFPSYAKDFYKVLEKGTNNDGKKDYFIEDKYFTKGSVKELLSSLTENTPLYSVIHTQDGAYMPVAQVSKKDIETVCNDLRAAFDFFKLDHPEVFWLCGWDELKFLPESGSSSKGGVVPVYLTLKLFDDDTSDIRGNGNYTEKKIRSEISKMEKSISSILKGMPSKDTAEKVRYFNNWLTKHNGPSTSEKAPDYSFNSLSAILGTTGEKGPMCLGYASAFKVLCDKAGIPCITVVSFLDAGFFHAWNHVQIEKAWYAVDATWNDPVFSNQKKDSSEKADSGHETEEYLLVGKNTLNNKGERFQDSHPADIDVYERRNEEYTLEPGPKLSEKAYSNIKTVTHNVYQYVEAMKNELEIPSNIFDNDLNTKWCSSVVRSGTFVIWKASEPIAVNGYAITTANDNSKYPGRNPLNWTLYGCNSDTAPDANSNWTVIDQRTDDKTLPDENFVTRYFEVQTNVPEYQYFMLKITETAGADVFQISEFKISYTAH